MGIRVRQPTAVHPKRVITALPLIGPSPSWPGVLPTTATAPAKAARRRQAASPASLQVGAGHGAGNGRATGKGLGSAATTAGTLAGGGVVGPKPGPAGRGVGLRFGELWGRSKDQAEGLAREVLGSGMSAKERVQGTRDLVHWAAASGAPEHRRLLVRVFKDAQSQPLLIHHLSELPGDQADTLMKDFFDSGGDESAIAEWLVMAGAEGHKTRPSSVAARHLSTSRSVARTRAQSTRLRGVFDWIGGAVSWVADAIKTVVDAVIKAGKSLASVIGKLVNMTVDQLTDAARALKKAGRAVGELLGAALTQTTAFLQKMVTAVLRAAYPVSGVLIWLASQVVNVGKVVAQALLAAGQGVLALVKVARSLAAGVMQGLLRALMAAGQGLAQIVAVLAGQLSSLVQPVIAALRAIGQTVRAILAEAVKLVAATARLVVQALLVLGTALATLLSEAAGLVAQSLHTVLRLLLELSVSVGQLVQALGALAMTAVRAVVGGLLAVGRTLAELVLASVQSGVQLARTLFGALLSLGRKTAEILVTLAGRAVSALRTALEALLALGQTLQAVVAAIMTGVAEGFRRGFVEGLMALGKAPLEILKAAALTSAAVALLACTVILEVMGGHRALSAAEREEARRIFGTAIDLDRVKVAVASLPANVINHLNGDRPFTSMYIINFGRDAVVEMPVLIHELAHVWQGVQQGPLYMTRALEAQLSAGLGELFHTGTYDDSAAYVVSESQLRANAGDFGKFNPEQQAWIVEHYWRQQFGRQTSTDWPAASALEVYARQVFQGRETPRRIKATQKRVLAPKAARRPATPLAAQA